MCGAAFIIAIPSPYLSQLRVQIAFHHLDNVFPENWEELPAMERPTSHDVEVLRMWMLADNLVLGWCNQVPTSVSR